MKSTFGNRAKEHTELRFDIDNYRTYMYPLEIPINKTFFNYGLLDVSGIDRNLLLNIPSGKIKADGKVIDELTALIAFYAKGYENEPYYGEIFQVSVNIKESESYMEEDIYVIKSEYVGDDEHFLTDDSEIDLSQFDCTVGISRNKIQHLGKLGRLQSILENIFATTKFASRMSNEKAEINCGETIKCEVGYKSSRGKGDALAKRLLCVKITECNVKSGEELVPIQNYNVPAIVCERLEREIFTPQHIDFVDKKRRRETDIFWYEPTDWQDIDMLELLAKDVFFGTYMWYGKNLVNGHFSVFIGYINGQSLFDRINQDKHTYSNIEIKSFRYSEITDSGVLSPEEVLKNVVMITKDNMEKMNLQRLKRVYTKDEETEWDVLPTQNEYTSDDSFNFRKTPTIKDVVIPDDITKLCDSENGKQFFNLVKSKMLSSHICKTPDAMQNNKINISWVTNNWLETTDEMKSQEADATYYGTYMWRGCYKNNEELLAAYTGIVGTTVNNKNSVKNRIFMQEMSNHKEYRKINLERYTFKVLSCEDIYVKIELLKTVEMQCINNLSALFPFYDNSFPEETEIKPLFLGVVDKKDSKRKRLVMMNDSKRYHNKDEKKTSK